MSTAIPRPVRAHAGTGALVTSGTWRIRSDDRLAELARTTHDLLRPHLGERLVCEAADHELTLRLVTGRSPAPAPAGIAPAGTPVDESYDVSVTDEGIVCQAGTETGLLRAATTAIQFLATHPEEVPAQELADHPRYAWRGLMVDPARGFVGAAGLRRLIDLAALYKLNVLHLHLTDNEGWRLELPGLPQLTAAGLPHYTAREYRDLQQYAAERHVTVVPEFDFPGHSLALRKAFPALAVPQVPENAAAVLKGTGEHVQFHPPLDLTDADTEKLVERMLGELCALTTGPFVHVGADEAVGLPEDSYVHAVTRLRAVVREHGKQPVGWQESVRAGAGPRDIGQFWFTLSMALADGPRKDMPQIPEEAGQALVEFLRRTEHDLPALVDSGARVLLSPQSHCYLDRPYDPDTITAEDRETVGRLGLPFHPGLTLEHLAAWDPAGYGVPDDQIAGIEATLFGETVDSFDDLTTLLLPRLPAIAEIAWSGSAPAWAEYRERLAAHAAVWRDRGLAFFASTEVPWPSADR